MRFLLDMGISQSIARWLNATGHNAIHLNDEKLHTLPDPLILEKAILEQRIVLTADTDFGQLLAINQNKGVSLIQFRVSDFTPTNIKLKLELLFEKFAHQLDGEFIITVEDNRVRFRKLPI